MATLEHQLRQAIERSGLTRYGIAKAAGINYDILSRYLDRGRDIRLSTVEKLAGVLGMEFTQPAKSKHHRPKHPKHKEPKR